MEERNHRARNLFRLKNRAWLRWGFRLTLAVLVFVTGLEIYARYGLGLGTPPLSVVDADAGYMFAPNQDVMRFGNHVVYNSYAMRSEQFPRHKSAPDELRVMVIGDSVINGGSLVDQDDLATTLLERELSDKLGKRVIVGNISAGGWSPANQWGYVSRHGLFDADVVVLVQNSHDARGEVTHEPLTRDFPTSQPVFALSEAVTRYLPRYLPKFASPPAPTQAASLHMDTDNQPLDTDTLKRMIDYAHQCGASVVLAQHPEKEEMLGSWKEGHDLVLMAAHDSGVEEVVQLRDTYRQAADRGVSMYRDAIHLNRDGQRLVADALEPVLLSELSRRVIHHVPIFATSPENPLP